MTSAVVDWLPSDVLYNNRELAEYLRLSFLAHFHAPSPWLEPTPEYLRRHLQLQQQVLKYELKLWRKYKPVPRKLPLP